MDASSGVPALRCAAGELILQTSKGKLGRACSISAFEYERWRGNCPGRLTCRFAQVVTRSPAFQVLLSAFYQCTLPKAPHTCTHPFVSYFNLQTQSARPEKPRIDVASKLSIALFGKDQVLGEDMSAWRSRFTNGTCTKNGCA